MKVTLSQLNQIIACPNCKGSIELQEDRDAECARCGETYNKLPFSWELIPEALKSFELLEAWEQLQRNGLVSYEQDPENNLSVGEREDCRAFSVFCGYTGLVLDVGCGIQAFPSYFSNANNEVRYVGIDPLVGESEAKYTQIRSVGEFMPFADESFDRVIFATSLDHVLDPIKTLSEAKRVCKSDGAIAIWVGEKSPDAPKPEKSPEWYENLEKPEGADDVFHYRRLSLEDVRSFISQIDCRIIDEEVTAVDEYRKRCFLRLSC